MRTNHLADFLPSSDSLPWQGDGFPWQGNFKNRGRITAPIFSLMPMIPKVKTGTGFSGVLQYALKEEKHAEILDKNMLGTTPRELDKEFRMAADANTRAEKKMKHFILSFADGDRPHLNREKMKTISREFLHGMGYRTNQYVTVRHNDNGHEHLHMIVNRISTKDGKAVKDGNEKYNGSRIARKLEKKYGLTITPSEKQEQEKKPESKEERELKKRLAAEAKPTLTEKETIRELVRKSMKGCRNMLEAIKKIRASGVDVIINGSKDGKKVTGWKFGYQGREYKASTIDRGLSWGNAKKEIEGNKRNRNQGMSI